MLTAIFHMTWRVGLIPTATKTQFLTADNPAYFFESLGIGTPNSELTFPLNSRLAIFGSWQGPQRALLWFEARLQLIKEANRRLCVGAERFIFCTEPAEWIRVLARKTEPQLRRITWYARLGLLGAANRSLSAHEGWRYAAARPTRLQLSGRRICRDFVAEQTCN
jgi:hypothetical protein